MHHTAIWDDINAAVRQALHDRWHLLDEGDLIERSDNVLETLPVVGNEQPTTALLLRRYRTPLQHELCSGGRVRQSYANDEATLLDITRAVIVAIDANEGLSIESAVLIALVIRAQGLDRFCAMGPAHA